MDAPLGEQVVALILTVLAVAIAGLIWLDMYAHGMAAAGPRDIAGLVLLAVVRWMLGKFIRTSAPLTTEED